MAIKRKGITRNVLYHDDYYEPSAASLCPVMLIMILPMMFTNEDHMIKDDCCRKIPILK